MSNTYNALIHAKQDGTGEEVANNKTGGGDGSLYAPVTSIATPENGDTASKAYAVGEMFIRGGKLCTCTVAISAGDALVKDTNYKEGDVGSVLTELNSNLTELHQLYNSGGYGYPNGGYIKSGRMVVGSTYIRLYNNYVQGMSICRADDKPIYIVAIRILNSTAGAYYDGTIDIDGHFRIGANIDTDTNLYFSFAYVTT